MYVTNGVIVDTPTAAKFDAKEVHSSPSLSELMEDLLPVARIVLGRLGLRYQYLVPVPGTVRVGGWAFNSGKDFGAS